MDPPPPAICLFSPHPPLPSPRLYDHAADSDRQADPPGPMLERRVGGETAGVDGDSHFHDTVQDRKSTRLNSSHANISYVVFCLKKKKLRHCIHEPSHNPRNQT